MVYQASLSTIDRLKSRKRIDFLFKEGQSLFSHPFKAYYYLSANDEAHQGLNISFGVSIPKSLVKRAVDRNRLKRVTREAYRKEILHLIAQHGSLHSSIDIFFVFIDKSKDETRIHAGISKILNQLGQVLSKI